MPVAMDIPYDVIAESFRNGTVVPFLGAAASFAGAQPDTALPSGRRLAEMLAVAGRYPGPASDPLSKIAQFVEEIPADRGFLLTRLVSIFGSRINTKYACGMTDFFDRLAEPLMPSLVVTTNYDILVERTLENRRLPYLAVSHVARNSKFAGRYVCYESLANTPVDCIWTKTRLEDRLTELHEQPHRTILLYKIHGTAHVPPAQQEFVDSFVLTESDYIEFLEEERLNKIPSRILELLRKANLLFLGYSLADWNFRVLLQRLQRIQQRQRDRAMKHWACRLMDEPDEVEERFWGKRGVNLYSAPLEEFLAKLLESPVVKATE